jgi:hypothetical protein
VSPPGYSSRRAIEKPQETAESDDWEEMVKATNYKFKRTLKVRTAIGPRFFPAAFATCNNYIPHWGASYTIPDPAESNG